MADVEAERLYGLPLDEFTAARDERARELRQEGQKEKAAEVAALRKPVVAAWVVNMLARDERADVREMVRAAEAIRTGKAGADTVFREALDRLTAAARQLLEAEGRSADATLQQVAGTLRAAAASEPDLLTAGTLTQPVEASGFGAMAGAALPPPGRGKAAKAAREPRVDRRAVERARKALAAARDEARSLERDASAAERAARKARQAADAARTRVADAEQRLADAGG